MHTSLTDAFCWLDEVLPEMPTEEGGYPLLIEWAQKARGKNPSAFDGLVEWMMDDSRWDEAQLAENEQLLMAGVLDRFRAQNAHLRACIEALLPSSAVNGATLPALDNFDAALAGEVADSLMGRTVRRVFEDFSSLLDPGTRRLFAGGLTGAAGTDTVDIFGYINLLKDMDASVQWTLFMPDVVIRQQNGFRVDSFVYRKLPALRLIGFEGAEYEDAEKRAGKMKELDALAAHASELPWDVCFMHHYDQGVDVAVCHRMWGRFMQADTPVPEGFFAIDLLPEEDQKAGPPYVAQFAYAQFTGDEAAMHTFEGFDVDAMYDVTRNIILSQNVAIPYPPKYWTAEVFPDGCDRPSRAYLFSALPD